jgi:CBS domain containing-hemolysin-like protein
MSAPKQEPGKEPLTPQRRRRQRPPLKRVDWRWAGTIVTWTFAISMGMSFASSQTLDNVGLGVAALVLLAFVLIGILFDIAGIAVATASEKPFHSMSSRRVPGAQSALWLIRRAEKVSNFCNDVVGDICGIISGATAAVIAARAAQWLAISLTVAQLVSAALAAAVTVGGKAVGKGFAMQYSTQIVHLLGRASDVFSRLLRRKSNGQ